MSIKPWPFLGITMRVLVGLFVLFIGYRMVLFELQLRKLEKAFLQTEHPENTQRIDSLTVKVNYYPATYVDDSMQFQSAFLVGEIRSYDGNWDALKTFYTNKHLEVGNSKLLSVWMVPLQIERNDQRSWLDVPDGFSFDPFQADILQALQEHYSSNKLTQRLGRVERSIYFVYIFADP